MCPQICLVFGEMRVRRRLDWAGWFIRSEVHDSVIVSHVYLGLLKHFLPFPFLFLLPQVRVVTVYIRFYLRSLTCGSVYVMSGPTQKPHCGRRLKKGKKAKCHGRPMDTEEMLQDQPIMQISDWMAEVYSFSVRPLPQRRTIVGTDWAVGVDPSPYRDNNSNSARHMKGQG